MKRALVMVMFLGGAASADPFTPTASVGGGVARVSEGYDDYGDGTGFSPGFTGLVYVDGGVRNRWFLGSIRAAYAPPIAGDNDSDHDGKDISEAFLGLDLNAYLLPEVFVGAQIGAQRDHRAIVAGPVPGGFGDVQMAGTSTAWGAYVEAHAGVAVRAWRDYTVEVAGGFSQTTVHYSDVRAWALTAGLRWK